MLSGKFSCNYYHELYEILIKLLVFNRINISKDAPLIIDEIVMKIDSFKKIFEILNETQRDIITIGEKEIVEFGTLYSLSAVNSIAPHYRDITDPDHLFGFVFDCHLTLQMRDKLLLFKSNLATPKRIFLTRKSTKKRHYNEFEVWGVLKEYGFEVVAPETYTFCEQMALFNNADYIVGGSGAAFTNLLFCHSGCKVICFRSIRNYSPIFSTIANIVDVKMRYLAGISDSTVDLHADYIVSTDKLKKMIDYNED